MIEEHFEGVYIFVNHQKQCSNFIQQLNLYNFCISIVQYASHKYHAAFHWQIQLIYVSQSSLKDVGNDRLISMFVKN